MKRILVSLAVFASAIAPSAAHAAVFSAGEQYTVGPQERIDGNLYVVGGQISVGGPVSGDVFAMGGNISVSDRVSGDVAAAGGMIQVSGQVNGDVRSTGGQVLISGSVAGDLLVAGGTVHILDGAVVRGDVRVVGGQTIIDGTVLGGVSMNGGQMTINGQVSGDVSAHVQRSLVLGSGASLGGTLSYRSPKEAQIASGASVAGKISYEPTMGVREGRTAKALFLAALGALTAIQMLALLGAVALVVWRWRRQAGEVLQQTKDAFLPSAGRGLVYGILTPVAVVLLLMSFIGAIPAGFLILAFLACLTAAKVLAGMFLGAWISARIAKRAALHVTWQNALGGTVLLVLLPFIPLVGWLVKVLIELAVFGALAHRAQETVTK